MPILTLKFKDNILGEFHLEAGKALTIGRRDSNDITIENLAVSGHHAKIDAVGEGYLLTDLKSKNGSFVNKALVNSHWLQQGDMITIGKHTLLFTYAKGENIPDPPPATMDNTMVMDTNKYREMVDHSAESNKSSSPGGPMGVLSFLSGGDGEVELNRKLTKLGKHSECDIIISGMLVGQTAATISKRPSGYSLSYVEGMAKPKVNGEAVRESVMLKEFDSIEIGSVKLQFYLKG